MRAAVQDAVPLSMHEQPPLSVSAILRPMHKCVALQWFADTTQLALQQASEHMRKLANGLRVLDMSNIWNMSARRLHHRK